MENNKISNTILVMPSFLIVFSITAYVLINTLKESLGLIPELFLNELTFKYYANLFTDKIFVSSFLYSIFVALTSALLSAVFGTYLGYVVAKSKNSFVNVSYRFPIFLSYVAAAVLIYNTYSDKGLLFHMFQFLGFEIKNLNIIYNSKGLAVILLNVFKGVPFIALSVYPILLKTDDAYKEAARNLGCTNIMYVRKILLPLCKRAILSSALVVFNYNLFAYEGFYFLGPSNPPSMGVLVYNNYINPDMTYRAYGMTMNMVMIAISLLLCVLYYRLLKSENEGAI
ncbi:MULTISPECIES: ABC transporter permease [unclassified Sedimentibacter]|uniref:ABC transporter permease n=1 Tax=unclassified Sedimentibacter TaxID=2649220 RepID=UPI0027E0A3AA|nr:ABC transporter permease subunit [Sedimentibacter sp. MB35-C1]WMJ76861.1 ABC transporter permease subunit [Sedimentibacter sp. MB35-C1]